MSGLCAQTCKAIVLVVTSLAGTSYGWSWAPADQYAPDPSRFVSRGAATAEFGAQFTAPGVPPGMQPLYGVIHYRDTIDSFRSYDLYFTPSLAIWKLVRLEPAQNALAQYVGSFNYANCNDGYVTATDDVLEPAIGATTAVECGSPVTSVRTNYGCMNNNYSVPFPIDNYDGAGSGSGVLSTMIDGPTWTASTQTVSAVSQPRTWIYYDGVLDPNNPRFLADFTFCPNRSLIQQQIAAAQNNLRLENQIRILPDGTIMLTHIWTDLQGRPWIAGATDGYWLPTDSSPNGRVFYYNPTTRQYVEPFANGQNPEGMLITTGSGWLGVFADPLRPDFGIGYYYYTPVGIGATPASNWPGVPAVIHTDYSTAMGNFGQAFRQMFITIGTKEDMQAKLPLVNPFVYVFNPAYPPNPVGALIIRPTSNQDASIPLTSHAVDSLNSPFGIWGKFNGAGYVAVGIHSLPCGLTASSVLSARLRIPLTDVLWLAETTPGAGDLTMMVRHIAATNKSQVLLADGLSTPLDTIGTYRSPGPRTQNGQAFVEFDVTSRLLADAAAGRDSFAWRIEPLAVPDGQSAAYYFPTVDNTDAFFPADNRGARLVLMLANGTVINANCADIDLDRDVDQSDFGFLQRCMGLMPAQVTACRTRDLNGDGRIDSDDYAAFALCTSGADITAGNGCYR